MTDDRSTGPQDPVADLASRLVAGDPGAASVLLTIIRAADESGRAVFNDVATIYRQEHLAQLRAEGRDAEREAGRLGLDEVRTHLANTVFPRLEAAGAIRLPDGGLRAPDQLITLGDRVREALRAAAPQFEDALRRTGDQATIAPPPPAPPTVPNGSLLEAKGLTKVYRRRAVVNDVNVSLRQGEIVGLLGPNGAGKTTTFYMIVGIIQPLQGTIHLDGNDITRLPMYKRARQGIGYLSQEPSVFRKLTVEQNLEAILQTLKLKSSERRERLERLLDELSIKHLRNDRAYSLSGGERRRLEITRVHQSNPKIIHRDLKPVCA